MRSLIPTSIVLAALSQLGSTDCGRVIRDDGFDLWCGEELCAWKLERGAVMRVPSWNEGDYAVELVGPDVAIEQLSPVNSGNGGCLRFDLIANVEERAEVYVNVDVQGDGTIEMAERLPTSNWKPLSYVFAVAAPYDGIRFEITKRGTGRGVIANVGAELVDKADCIGLSLLDPGRRRNGARCLTGGDCLSGMCQANLATPSNPSTCTGCDPYVADLCGPGQVCGVTDDAFSPVFAMPVECVAAGAKVIGQNCIADAECASGICSLFGTYGACSGCFDDGQCPTGQHCIASTAGLDKHPPHICSGGEHLAEAGAPCAANDDCASGACNGALRAECEIDGRPCLSPADCPFQHLSNTACSTVGLEGGTCQ